MEPGGHIVGRVPPSATLLARAFATLPRRSTARPLDPMPLIRKDVVLPDAHIAAYAAVCGFANTQGVPLTYPHLLAFPLHVLVMTRPTFPLPVVGLVHLRNRIVQHAVLHPGDIVTVAVALGSWLTHEKGQAFTIESTISRDDTCVWGSQSTYLRLGAAPRSGDAYAGPDIPDRPVATLQRWDLPANLGRRYARISADWNPIHLSGLSARLLGQKRALAHGMWLKARALAAILPAEPVLGAEADVAFKAPAYLPGRVTLLAARAESATILEIRDGNDEKPHLRGVLRNVLT